MGHRQIARRQRQRMPQGRRGDVGQRGRGVDGVDPPRQPGQADAEYQTLTGVVQGRELRFDIIRGRPRELPREGLGNRRRIRHRVVEAFVEQIIEQQRMRDHALGEESTVREYLDQACARTALLGQQGEVRGASGDRVQ
jgi:hypothetical protein